MKNSIHLDKDLVHNIDQLIIETACYQPVELLLRLNVLAYADYEQWCMGKSNYLCDCFKHNQKEIIRILDEALYYVRSLKLESEPMIVYQWQQNESTQIVSFCPDNSIFSTKLDYQYIRKNDDDQMDLFFDNQSLSIVKELKQALVSRNIRIASQQFEMLYQTDPEHEFFQPAKILLDALVNALEEDPVSDSSAEMHYLLNELGPLAEKHLPGKQRDYMALFWHRLAAYSDNDAYHEDDHTGTLPLHASFCYQQIPDWQAVINSIEHTADAAEYPGLSARKSLALIKSGQRENFIQSVCQFCWQFFTTFAQNPEATFMVTDTTLKQHWHAFLDQELDEQWGIQHFPTWLLIKQPGISHYIHSSEQTPESFKQLQQLTLSELGKNTQDIALRKQLQQTHPEIIKHYLSQSS